MNPGLFGPGSFRPGSYRQVGRFGPEMFKLNFNRIWYRHVLIRTGGKMDERTDRRMVMPGLIDR